MIDFRYHVVSIVAVFLALAVGIVVGTTALNGPILHDLHRNVNDLRNEKHSLEQQVRGLEGRIDADTAFASAVEPQIVSGVLPHERVVVVSAPHAPSGVRNGVMKDLALAGATVTAQVQLSNSYVDAGHLALLGDLADRLTPVDMPPLSGSPDQRAAALLADVLVGNTSNATFTSVLQGFNSAGVLTLSQPAAAGTMAVVIGGSASQAPTPVVSLVSAFATHAAGVVVAGQGDQKDDPLVYAVRGHRGNKVATVDDADTPVGRAAVVLALAHTRDGHGGDFGVGPGASAPLPTPSPTP